MFFFLCRSWHLWRRTCKRRVPQLQVLQAPVTSCILACSIRCHDTQTVFCCHRANCVVLRQRKWEIYQEWEEVRELRKKWEIYHSAKHDMNGKKTFTCSTTWCLLWIPAFMFARMTQVLKCDSVAFLPHWRSSGHRRSWPQHAWCWKAMATHSLCLLWSHESGPQSLNINMSIRKAKLKTHTMKCNSLLPAKVACGADLKQSWNDMKLHEMTWNDISNSQATHIKQSKIVKTSQARTCSME